MRRKNYKGRCEKRTLTKCQEVVRTYDEIQYAYADVLERNSDVKSYQLLYRLYVNGMIDEYYETLGRLYSVMYKKENLLDEGMKFRRSIPAYKIWYTSTAEYKDIDIYEHVFNLNEMFMKSVYNSFKKKRKMIESIAYSDDPNHSVILYTYKDGDKMNIDVSGKSFDRTAFYRNIDLYRIRYWMCKILKIINEDEKFFVVEIE